MHLGGCRFHFSDPNVYENSVFELRPPDGGCLQKIYFMGIGSNDVRCQSCGSIHRVNAARRLGALALGGAFVVALAMFLPDHDSLATRALVFTFAYVALYVPRPIKLVSE
jgi:hypothetical protein